MSELFDDLYEKAQRREHPQITMVSRLLKSMETYDLAACARLAAKLVPAWQEFDDALMDKARRARCRIAKYHEQCTFCGRSDCPASVPMMQWQADYYAYLLQGGAPIEFEESGS